MKIGTKSVLFGAHQFILHPIFVAIAWYKLYGFPYNPLLWISFFVHDLGYLGKSNLENEEGERHVEWGAWIMGTLGGRKWYEFSLYHSRFYAKKDQKCYSKLCVADKYSIVLMPSWLYLPLVTATGEIYEYMDISKKRAAAGESNGVTKNITKERWFINIQKYLEKWALEHKDIKEDTWTPIMP